MGKCSTLFYIIDQTDKKNEFGLCSFEDFLDNTDNFLTAFLGDTEFEVDSKVVNGILEASK